MSIHDVVGRFVIENYGNLIQHLTPEFKKTEKYWVAPLSSDYPVLIKDDLKEKRSIRFIKTGHIGYVVFDESLTPVDNLMTSEEEVVTNLELYLGLWRGYAERIVLAASADRIAMMEEVSVSLNPIYTILLCLNEEGSLKPENYETNELAKDNIKMLRYLTLLESLQVIRKHDNKYVPGNLFIALDEKLNNIEKIKHAIFSEVLRKQYSFLKEVLSLTTLERIIRLENIVYYPELEMRSAVPRSRTTLQTDYSLEYDVEMSKPDMITYLHKLRRIGVIERKGNLFRGKDDLRKDMFQLQKSIMSPESAWSIASPF